MKKTVVFALALCLFMTGCWDNKELNTISIVTGMGIDTSPEGYNLVVQVGKPQASGQDKSGGKDEDAIIILESEQSTIQAAVERLKQETSRELFLQHNQVIVFGKEQAEEGVADALDLFMRDNQTRLEVWVVVSETSAKDILAVQTNLDKNSAFAINSMINNEREVSYHIGVNLLEFISTLSTESASAVAPIMAVEKDKDDNDTLVISGMAVFKGKKMVASFDERLTQGYIWGAGKVKKGKLEVDTGQGIGVLKEMEFSYGIEPVVSDDGIKAKITIKGSFDILELEGFEGAGLDELYEIMKQGASRHIAELIQNTFEESKKIGADIFKIGELIEKHDNKKWEEIKGDWDNEYKNVELEVDADALVINAGKIGQSLEMEGIR